MVRESDKKHVVIIGAGMSGMGAAIRLLKAGYHCTLLEAAPAPGGLASSFAIKGRYFPLGYHHILAEDKPLLSMLSDLELLPKVVWKKSKVGFALNEKIYNLENPADFIRFPLSLIHKIRFVVLMLYCFIRKNWTKDLGTAEQWLDKIAGKKVRETIFDPLMDIKYGLPSSFLSANWLGSRLHYKEFSKPLGYIPGDDWTKLLVDKMVEKIRSLGGTIITSAVANKIVITENQCEKILYTKDGIDHEMQSPIIINTAPPHIFRKFSDYATHSLEHNEYIDALSLIVEIKETLPKDFYLLSCLKPRYTFGGIFVLSALNTDIGTEKKTVLNFFTNLSPQYEYVRNKTAEELFELYAKDFEKIFKFRPTPLWKHLTLIKNYSPKFLKDYTNPDSRGSARGLYFAGNYLTYPIITSTGSAMASGEKTAEFIINDYGV